MEAIVGKKPMGMGPNEISFNQRIMSYNGMIQNTELQQLLLDITDEQYSELTKETIESVLPLISWWSTQAGICLTSSNY